MTSDELQAFVDALPVPTLVVVQEQILAANAQVAAILQAPPSALISSASAVERYVSGRDQPRIFGRVEARGRGEAVEEEVIFTALDANGLPLPIRARVAPFPAAGAQAVLVVIDDERVHARSADVIRGFVDIAVLAQRERTVAGVFRVVREKLLELGVTSTALELTATHFRFAPFVPPMSDGGREARRHLEGWVPLSRSRIDFTNAAGALVDDVGAFVADMAQVPREQFAGRFPSRGSLATIRIAGEPKYVLVCLGEHLDAAVSNAFALLARQLGAVVEVALTIEELDRRNAELSLLFELGRELTGGLDLDRVLQTAANNAARALRCSCAYVFVPDAERRDLIVAARCDPDPALGMTQGESLPLDVPSLSTLAFQTLETRVSSDNLADARVDRALSDRFQCRSTLAVPLVSQGRGLGVLTLFERSDRIFDDGDARLATLAAQLISSALQNARLYSEAKAQAEEMALLNDVAQRIAGSLELRPLLQLGGETLQHTVGGDLWFMMLPDENAGGLTFAALAPEFEDIAGMILPFSGGTAAAVAYRERRVVQLVRSQFRSPESLKLAARFGHRATIAVPLIARDQCLGVAIVLDKDHSRTFTQAQMDRAAAVAGQLSLALLSARLYEDLRESYAALERTQKELIDRERLAALGELSASIAHEVRNPLGVIFNSVGSLRRLLRPAGDVAMLLDIVAEEADRLNRMVGDLLDYSRPVRPAMEPVPLRPILEEALSSAQQQVGQTADGVKPKLRVAISAATVRADPRLLRQALVNLFLNALQAMPRGGHLEVRASLSGRAAEIVINDTGPGIPAELRGRIFQPFFTTKATGTGLGLAVVKRIVEGHGGSIEVGNVSVGAEFRLRLPLEAGTR